MDDIIAATGMSSSAVYRYVRSKDELIEAATDEALAQLGGFFARMLDAEPTPTPAETITALVDELASGAPELDYDLSKIAMHAWAEALRRPDVGVRIRAFYREMRGRLAELALLWRTAGYLSAETNPEDVATVLVTLMPGLIVNQHLVDPVSADQLISGSSTLVRPPRSGFPGRGGAIHVGESEIVSRPRCAVQGTGEWSIVKNREVSVITPGILAYGLRKALESLIRNGGGENDRS
jgi:AcrR family transcriptional regulator